MIYTVCLTNYAEVWECRRFGLSTFRFVDVLVCRRFGLSTFRFVDVLVCRRFGLSTFRSVDVLVCRRFGLSTFRFVDVLVCRRFGCRRFGLSTFWLVTTHETTAAVVFAKFRSDVVARRGNTMKRIFIQISMRVRLLGDTYHRTVIEISSTSIELRPRISNYIHIQQCYSSMSWYHSSLTKPLLNSGRIITTSRKSWL